MKPRSSKTRPGTARFTGVEALAVLVVALLALLPEARAGTKEMLTVAIFDFESKADGARELGSQIPTLLNANLSAEPEIITVERAELGKVLGEQELGLSGTVSAETAAKVEHLTGAKVLVTGRMCGKLPSGSLKIAERHFGQPVIDPAAETELGLMLKECGFTLVEDKSPGKADIEIVGEAFSTYGTRKGNLISCKARIELKVQKRTGEILAVDRQTSVGVDIAEQTAANTAPQNAAAELASRLLPKLGK